MSKVLFVVNNCGTSRLLTLGGLMNNQWDIYVNARNNLVKDLIEKDIDLAKLVIVEKLYKEYVESYIHTK